MMNTNSALGFGLYNKLYKKADIVEAFVNAYNDGVDIKDTQNQVDIIHSVVPDTDLYTDNDWDEVQEAVSERIGRYFCIY